ncbi:MAG: hypothetical protein NW207_01605 [Cytophagales bacterium]|nr:hypothetical protein [Cytophagales bacterium]
MKKIVLITTGQPATNPRIVKEADALAQAGYDVVMIGCVWSLWATLHDADIINNAKWKYISVPTSHHIFEKLLLRGLNIIARYITAKYGIAERVMAKHYDKMCKTADNIGADLYIAHNLGALSVAYQAAQKYHATLGFDAEDFHRYEADDNAHSAIASYLENKYLPHVKHFTVSSPLIAKEYTSLFPNLKPVLLHNVFYTQQRNIWSADDNVLKIIWFSQTIGKGRGLEAVIEALGRYNGKVQLTLIGHLNDVNRSYFDNLMKIHSIDKQVVKFLAPVSPAQIFDIVKHHHIGLALEQHTPYNRDICLTNKIFTYISCGCAIIASDTLAQNQFMALHLNIGVLVKVNDADSISKAISKYLYDRDILQTHMQQSHALGAELYNWNIEKNKLLSMIVR